ncbi:MAG TPA: SDR family oxidoreductase [Clostridiales bacterium]|jgi:NAD(P)-dependent dehydrogenase (short-subunit alcohol dehydrogenase family)|nr:SDR family oxidoreductase [Clostridiales bacterium]
MTNTFPPQHQPQHPGNQERMNPKPVTYDDSYIGTNKLKDMVAIVTGGDSGIGQAIAIIYAKEGANIVVPYFTESGDANETARIVQQTGRRCVLVKCDLRQEQSAREVVDTTLREFGKIDILVNNIAVQYPQNSIEDITAEQLDNTFKTNIYSYFFMTKAVLPHLKAGSAIINTTSVTAYKGSTDLIDYSATKGAIVSFTRSLSLSLAQREIRVNAVAPGPVWTPLIPSSFSPEKVEQFGSDVPMQRAAQPVEIAPAYVYLASKDSSFVTGQVMHLNGGVITES